MKVDLTEKEIRVIKVALSQHWNKMVDDNGDAKNKNLQKFADICYQTSQKFDKLDIVEKTFEELND